MHCELICMMLTKSLFRYCWLSYRYQLDPFFLLEIELTSS
uniref:Uncharacterized protein n=1 Tax=Arundo donax TaxID=35708 RepID=A0A0A9B959_ARUDO